MFLRMVVRGPEGSVSGGGGGGAAPSGGGTSGGAAGGGSSSSSSGGGGSGNGNTGSTASGGAGVGQGSGGTAAGPAAGAGGAGGQAAPTGAEGAELEGPKWPKGKFKVKRGGAETELDVETAYKMLGEDYEHEFALDANTKAKFKWPDIERHVQRSQGAEQLMREAAQRRKDMDEAEELGRKDPVWYLENRLGVEDPLEFAHNLLMKAVEEEAELKKLAQTDESAFFKKMEERAAKKLERKKLLEQRKTSAAEQARKQAEAEQRGRQVCAEKLQALKLPTNERMMKHVEQALRGMMEVGFRPADPLAHAIAEARKTYDKETFGWFDEVPDEQLLETLGERAERIRKLHLAAVQGGGARPEGGAKKEPRTPAQRRSEPGELTAQQLRERWQNS